MKHRFSRVFFLALALAFLPACTIRHIREAQAAFDDAARAELEQRPVEGSGARLMAAPAYTGYEVALGLVERELAENGDELAADGLTDTALMLRALCAWRLWDLGEAQGDAPSEELSEALLAIEQYGVDKLGTRDRVMYYALPGLHDHDRALRAQWPKAAELFQSAIETTDKALRDAGPPQAHPIRAYIALAQMSTCRAWQLAAFRSTNDPDEQQSRIQKPRDLFEGRIESVRPLWQEDEVLYEQIRRLCGEIGVTPPSGR